MGNQEQFQNFFIELRRGSLVLSVLANLKQPHYGYSLLQTLQEQGIDIEANTLYPLLRRLNEQGILESEWDTAESRPRKYYTISKTGTQLLKELSEEWNQLNESIGNILKENL